MNISDAFRLHQQILHTKEEITRVKAGINYTHVTLTIMFATTFLLYFIFSMGFYVTDLFGISTWLVENTSEFVAFGIFFVMALLMAISLSRFKHVFYEHKAEFVYAIGITLFIALLGIMMEVFNSTSHQQNIAYSKAESSKTFAAIASENTTPVNSGIAESLAAAQKRLAQCEYKLAQGKTKHCNGDKSTVESLKASMEEAGKVTIAASTAAISAKASAIQDLKDDNAKPIFKSIRDIFGVTLATALILVAAFFTSGFEFSHALLSRILREKMGQLKSLHGVVTDYESDYIDITGTRYSPDDFSDDRIIDLSDNPLPDTRRQEGDGSTQPKRDFGFIRNTPMATPQPAMASSITPPTRQRSVSYVRDLPSNYNRALLPQGVIVIDDVPVKRKSLFRLFRGKATRQSSAHNANVGSSQPTPSQVVENADNTVNNTVKSPERVNTVLTQNPVFTVFSDIPDYGVGHCAWCGVKLEGKTTRAKFCSGQHKDAYWNLKKPALKRTDRKTA